MYNNIMYIINKCNVNTIKNIIVIILFLGSDGDDEKIVIFYYYNDYVIFNI